MRPGITLSAFPGGQLGNIMLCDYVTEAMDTSHSHDHDHSHKPAHSHDHAHHMHAPIVPGWSLLRLSVLGRLALVSLPLALIWAATLVLIG